MNVLQMVIKRLEFSDFIRRRRLELGLTQGQVAKASGFDSSGDYISLVENGKRNIDLDAVPKIARVLNVEPGALCWLALKQQYPDCTQALLKSAPRLRVA